MMFTNAFSELNGANRNVENSETKHDSTERTWQDMWPKNDHQQDLDYNAYAAVCEVDIGEELPDNDKIDEQERAWKDMWP